MFNTILNTLVAVVVILTLGVLVAVLVLIWDMPDRPRRVITDELCLPAKTSDLVCGRTEDRLYDFTEKRIDVEVERLTLDFDKYVENVNHESNDHLKEFVRGIYDNRKPAARVVMRDNHRNKRDTSSPGSTEMVTIRDWENNRDYGGFLQFGMQVKDGRVMIPLTGTYTVSSHIDILPKPGTKQKGIRHAIFKYNILENREVELVSNLQPKQNCTENNYNEQNSYLNTIVRLTSGEELSVKVSGNVDLGDRTKNYLAVYLI